MTLCRCKDGRKQRIWQKKKSGVIIGYPANSCRNADIFHLPSFLSIEELYHCGSLTRATTSIMSDSDIGPDFPFKPTPPAPAPTLKIEHDCGVKTTAVGPPLHQNFR